MEQLQLDLVFEIDEKPIPGNCPFETRTVNMSDKGTNIKSFCAKMDCWTNCREMEHCTSRK